MLLACNTQYCRRAVSPAEWIEEIAIEAQQVAAAAKNEAIF